MHNLTIMGDFNYKEMKWEEWSAEAGEELWGNVLLRIAVDNILRQ